MFKNSISEFYSEEFSTIGEHDLLGNCIQSLKKGKPASMLVVDNAGRYVGVIGQRQLRSQHLDASKTKIASVMQPAPRIDISDTLTRAATLMIRTDIRTLPVLENKKLVGIITADDVIAGAVLEDWGEEKLEAIQSTNLITFSPEDNVGSVRATFRKNKISHAPVVKNQELDGIISASAVLDFSTSPRFRATRGERKGERINMADIPIKRVYVTSVITGRKNESIR